METHTGNDNETGQNEGIRKSPLDDLSREELLKKCKWALGIAQKAKQAKTDYQTENEKLSAEIKDLLKHKQSDCDSIKTLQELVESLTEQKLNYITEIDAANGKVSQLVLKCKELDYQIENFKEEIIVNKTALKESNEKLAQLDNENVSYKRQLKRLQDENEQLINQLGELESHAAEVNNIGMMQREQLKMLEETVSQGSENENIKYELSLLRHKLSEFEADSNKTRSEHKEMEEKFNKLVELYDTEKIRSEKASIKLKCYRDKIVKCATFIKSLKNSKFILLKTVKEYSESIPKWQNDIIRLSQMLSDNFKKAENDIKELTETLTAERKKNEKNLNDNILLKQQIQELVYKFENKECKADNLEVIESMKLQIKSLEAEKLTLLQEKQKARDRLLSIDVEVESYKNQIKTLTSESESMKLLIESFETEKSNMNDELQKLKESIRNSPTKSEHEQLRDQYETVLKENNSLADLNTLLKEEVETLKSALERPSDGTSEFNDSLQADLLKLETKLAAYKQENASLLQEVKETRPKLKELHRLTSELEEANAKLQSYKSENTELLNEMKEVNQVMKERGEKITKKQMAIVEMEMYIDTLEKDLEKLKAEKEKLESKSSEQVNQIDLMRKEVESYIDKIEKSMLEKESAIKTLEETKEIVAQLRDENEKLKQQNDNVNDETMSTSTISHAEDRTRMKDLDESFEDKYTKLRMFALKLKKRTNELQAQLEAEKSKNEGNQTDAKNMQVMQKEIDHLNDLLETKSKEIVDLKVIVASSTSEQISINGKQEWKDEIKDLKAKLESIEEQLVIEKQAHSMTKESLDQARKSIKKKSVLTLEMEDYERSMKDLNVRMDDCKKKMVQMESTIDTQQGTINSLKTQVKLLEEQIKNEETQSRLTKEELHITQEELKEKNNQLNKQTEFINKLQQEIEILKQSLEEQLLEMSSVIGEKESAVNGLMQDKMEIAHKLKKSETQNIDLEERLKIVNMELDELKTEFTSYKVRAQAVLRQNQVVDYSAEERYKEDNAILKSEIETLKNQLALSSAQLEELKSKLSEERHLSSENHSVATRASQRCRRLEADALKLTEELDNIKRQHQLQVTTLTQCYKNQICELELRLQKETTDLSREIESLKQLNHLKSNVSTKTASAGGSQLGVQDDASDDIELNVSMLPREEGEGSEFAPSPPLSKSFTAGRRSPLPLERLLEEGVPEDDGTNVTATLGLSAEQELAECQRKLHVHMHRARHVTDLLSESERECARLVQLNELLKAEVRRASGNIERTAHIHNAEYLKNVTLKFLTLSPGDERQRLVPVLQKILTLSPEETHKLNSVAKGHDPNSSRGWGSYLPWPAPK